MSTTFGRCPDCPKEARSVRLWGTGTCLHHYQHPVVKGSKKAVVKPTPDEVAALAATVIAKPTKRQLDAWFTARVQEMPACCEEPGCERHLLVGAALIKAHVCHIVPKRIFWSVAVHPLNRLFMCQTPHHDDFDSSWDRAQHMGIWPVAIDRFQQFMHLITDKELRYLPPALRELTKR